MAQPTSVDIQPDVTWDIARHLVARGYGDLPPRAIAATKEHVLHTVGTMVGGSSAPGASEAIALAQALAGPSESTIFVHGARVTALDAAMVNGLMGHSLEFDCCDERVAIKPSIAPIAAGFAMADRLGGISGQEFIAAVCLGADLSIRLGLARQPKYSQEFARVAGPFGAAATAGKLLGLNEEQMGNALGVAYCHSAPGGTTLGFGSLTKRLHAGLAARGGVFSALLAQLGFKGGRHIFEGHLGYYRIFTGREGDLGELTSELGERYEIVNAFAKANPSCRYTQGPIEGALRLRAEHHLTPDQIKRVVVRLSPHTFIAVGGGGDPEVLAMRRQPQADVDAQFSAPFTVATALCRGRVFLEHFTDAGLTDPEVLRLAERVEPVADASLETGRMVTPSVVEIECHDGRQLRAVVEFPKGSPENPILWDELETNFRDLAPFAAFPLRPDQVDESLRLLADLEHLSDVSAIPSCLSATGARLQH